MTQPGGEQQGGAAGGQAAGQGDDEVLESAKEIPAAELLAWVRQQLGKRYVFGADGPDTYDCSGLVLRAFGRYGVKMNHLAADQASYGRSIGKNGMLPGDLVFFNLGRGRNSHVGIATSATTFIEAPNSRNPVRETTLNDYYRSRITAVRRIPNVVQGAGSAGTATRGATAGGSGSRATPGGAATPTPTGTVGTGSGVPTNGGATPTGSTNSPDGQADSGGGLLDTLATAVKVGLSPLTSIAKVGDKLISAFFPTMMVRVACGVTGAICVIVGIILFAIGGNKDA